MSHRILKNTNLKASEIRDALAAGGGIVNNNTLTFFKKDANVNLWSKYKPVTVINGPDFVQDFYPNDEYYHYQWWKSKDGNCGVNVQATNGISPFINNIREGNYGWEYVLPESPYRLGDFRNYDIDAHCPISGEFQDDYWVELDRLTFTLDVETELPDTNLTLDDIQVTVPTGSGSSGLTKLSDYYPGVLLWKEVNGMVTDFIYPTSNNKAGTESVTLTLNGFDGDAQWGEWYAIPYLSSAPQELRGDEQVAANVSLNVAPKKIYIHGPGTLVISIMNASFKSPTSKEVQYELYIDNNNSSDLTVTADVWISRTIRNDNAPNGDAGEIEGRVYSTETITVPANTKVTYYSTNYESSEPIDDSLKICPALSVITRDDDTYKYWAGSRVQGYAITWWDLDEAEAPEEQNII